MTAFRQVAELAPIRQPIRGRLPRNPMDKCTIVSIYPKKISEVKHTIEPGKFEIEAGSLETPAILVIGSSSWWANRGENQPTLEIPVFSVSIADSIIRDYANGMLACDMETRMPGLFFVEGAMTVFEIKNKFKERLAQAEVVQRAWFGELCRIADSLWARSNNNPLAIPDEARVAAKYLGLEKPWTLDFKLVDMIPCFACGSQKNPTYPVCFTCKAIDPNHPMAKEIQFAK